MPSTCRRKQVGDCGVQLEAGGSPGSLGPVGPHPHFRMLGSSETYFVTLKIRSNLRARNTLMPKEVPGLMTAQMTSKMLPMMTWAGGGGRECGVWAEGPPKKQGCMPGTPSAPFD